MQVDLSRREYHDLLLLAGGVGQIVMVDLLVAAEHALKRVSATIGFDRGRRGLRRRIPSILHKEETRKPRS